MNEQAALQLVFNFINTKSLLSAAVEGFNNECTSASAEAADLINKAIITYLK